VERGWPPIGVFFKNMTVEDRAKKIKLFLLDVDGVLTDGRIIYDEEGDELKFFHVQDGMGLSLLNRAGIKTAFITSRKSKAVARRAKDCGVAQVYFNAYPKIESYKHALKKFKAEDEQTAYMGDDLFDLIVMKKAGLAISVPNACAEVKTAGHYMTTKAGGKGAVREAAELILKAQNKWDEIIRPYQS